MTTAGGGHRKRKTVERGLDMGFGRICTVGGGVRAPKYLSGLERAGSAVVHIFPLNVGLWSQVERQRATV